MKARTLLLLLLLGAITAFTALNWNTFLAPTTLSLGFDTIQAPFGLIMLAVLILFTTLFLVYVVYLQTSVLLETRSHAKELKTNRELADQAEASRFTELRSFMEQGLKQQATLNTESRAMLMGRVDQLDADLRLAVEQSANSISAYIGQLEDRLDKGSFDLTPLAPTAATHSTNP